MKRMKLIEKEEDFSLNGMESQQGGTKSATLLEKKIVTNPLITDVIFADLLHSDLLNCSLVSKAWNLTCRGSLLARFRSFLTLSERSTLDQLKDLLDMLRNVVPGHQHPFNGVRIEFTGRNVEWPFTSAASLGRLRRILEQLEVKFVSLSLSQLKLKGPEFRRFVKTLVVPHFGTIELLEILDLDATDNLKILSKQLKTDSLRSVKELNLHMSNKDQQKWDLVFKRVLKACPNLKTFPPVLPYQLPTLRDTNKLHLATKVTFDYMRLTANDLELLQDYGAQIRHLKLHYDPISEDDEHQYEGFHLSRLEPLFSRHLQHTLRSLEVGLEPLIAIILQKRIRPLRNLQELVCSGGQIWFPCLFKNEAVRFAEFPPKLESLTFRWTLRDSTWLDTRFGTELFIPAELFECKVPASLDSVTTLKLCGERENRRPNEAVLKLMDLEQVFPCVTHLEIGFRCPELEDLLRWICECWGDVLQTLVLRRIKCLGFYNDSCPDVLGLEWKDVLESKKRNPLPSGVTYSDKLSRLRHLELEFYHKFKPGERLIIDEEKNVRVQGTLRCQERQDVQLFISGCRAAKRVRSVKPGTSVFDAILGLHSCPRNLELSAMEEILASKSICRHICKMLSSPDLLLCSSVNKNWKSVARDVLYEDRTCTLAMRPMDLWGTSTQVLTELLEMKQKFFNGLRLISTWDLKLPTNNDNSTAEAVLRFLEKRKNFDDIRFKVLQVPGFGNDFPTLEHNKSDHRMFIGFGSQVLTIFKVFLTKLELDLVQTLIAPIDNFDELFRDAEGKLLVPNLKSIAFVDPEKLLEHCQVFKRLLVDLKFLERIDVPFSNKLLPLVSSAGKAHCVKHIQLYKFPENEVLLPGSILSQAGESQREMALDDPRTALGSLIKFAQELQPLIETLFVGDSVSLGQENKPVFGKIFQLLSTSSYNALQTFHLSLPLLHLITNVYTRPFLTLRRIEMIFDKTDSDRLLIEIPFSQMVPNLQVVELTTSKNSSFEELYDEQHSRSTSVLKLQPCISVKRLKFKVSLGGNASQKLTPSNPEICNLEFIAEVFPLATKLSFLVVDASTTQFGNIFPKMLNLTWKCWSNLEILKFSSSAAISAVSFETWVFGISNAEWSRWTEILENDFITPDLLNDMHYAPSSLSFRNCKYLRELRINGSIKTRILGRICHKYLKWDKIYLLPQKPPSRVLSY